MALVTNNFQIYKINDSILTNKCLLYIIRPKVTRSKITKQYTESSLIRYTKMWNKYFPLFNVIFFQILLQTFVVKLIVKTIIPRDSTYTLQQFVYTERGQTDTLVFCVLTLHTRSNGCVSLNLEKSLCSLVNFLLSSLIINRYLKLIKSIFVLSI